MDIDWSIERKKLVELADDRFEINRTMTCAEIIDELSEFSDDASVRAALEEPQYRHTLAEDPVQLQE